jgi:hypothetical protein
MSMNNIINLSERRERRLPQQPVSPLGRQALREIPTADTPERQEVIRVNKIITHLRSLFGEKLVMHVDDVPEEYGICRTVRGIPACDEVISIREEGAIDYRVVPYRDYQGRILDGYIIYLQFRAKVTELPGRQ